MAHHPPFLKALEARHVNLVVSATDSLSDAIAVAGSGVDVVIACAGGSSTESVDRLSLELDQHALLVGLGVALTVASGSPPLVSLAMAPG